MTARRSLVSRSLRFNAAGRGERCLRRFSRAALCCACWFAAFLSRSATKRSAARRRFWCWERDSRAVTLVPVGRCRSVTAVETLLTFWPPGPADRAKNSSNWDSSKPSAWIRSISPGSAINIRKYKGSFRLPRIEASKIRLSAVTQIFCLVG